MNRRALAGREKVLGVDHPDTSTSVNNLALVLLYQGKYKQAEEMNRRGLAGYEKVLGVHHPDTLASVNFLAHLLSVRKAAITKGRGPSGRAQRHSIGKHGLSIETPELVNTMKFSVRSDKA